MNIIFPFGVDAIAAFHDVLDHIRHGADRVAQLIQRVIQHPADLRLRILRLAEKIRQTQRVEVFSVACCGARGVALRGPACKLIHGLSQRLRHFYAEDRLIERLPGFPIRTQRKARDHCRVCTQEAAVRFCVILPACDAERVRQVPRRVPRKVLSALVAQRAQGEGQKLRRGDGLTAAEARLAHACGQAVCIRIAHIRLCPVCDVDEGRVPVARKRLILFSQQAHEHRDRLCPRGRAVQIKYRLSGSVRAGSLEKSQLVQRLRRLLRLRLCRKDR